MSKPWRAFLTVCCGCRDMVRNRRFLPLGRVVYNRWSDRVILTGSGALEFRGPGARLHLSDMDPGRFPGGDRILVRGILSITGRVGLRHGGNRIYVGPRARVEIGHGTFLAGDVEIAALQSISIGARCAIARRVYVTDSDWHTLIIDDVPREHTQPVVIGDDCWLGRDVQVLKGTTIGTGAVAAAGAVIVGSIPPRTLWGGVPARPLRAGVSWDSKRLEADVSHPDVRQRSSASKVASANEA